MREPPSPHHSGPLLLKHLPPDRIKTILAGNPRLIVPVGKTEEHRADLPLGCDTLIVERLADDVSTALGVLRAPTVEYGVNATGETICPGTAGVRRKTLHRFLNDLVGHWEKGGVSQFIILTTRAFDPHQEALSTLYTRHATVRTVDVLAISQPETGADWTEIPYEDLDAALLSYIAPDLSAEPRYAAEQGERLYRTILDRIIKGLFP